MKPIISALPALVLALACCSAPAPPQEGSTVGASSRSADSPSATPLPTAMPAGLYKLTTESGADITFRLPTPATDPAVAAIEAYRVKVGAAPVSYLVADVDNRQGTSLFNMSIVSAFDKEGRQFTFSSVAELIHSWAPTYSYDYKWTIGDGRVLDEAVGAELRREANDLYNANINDAGMAERTTIILACADTELPAEFTRVAVQPSGTENEEEARPAQ